MRRRRQLVLVGVFASVAVGLADQACAVEGDRSCQVDADCFPVSGCQPGCYSVESPTNSQSCPAPAPESCVCTEDNECVEEGAIAG